MDGQPKTRVGIIGLGKMGGFHLQKCLSLPEVQVVGFFEPSDEKAEQIERTFSITRFGRLEELLFEVDAAVISSPTETHASHACLALESGVHVLVEKPIASSIADAQRMVQLAEEKNRVLQVGMVERFRLAALAKDLPLKQVLFIETHRLTPSLGREGGLIDVVSDLMIHDLDLALSLVSEDPSTVSAIGMKVATGQHDIANVRLEFPSGTVMNLNASRVSAEVFRKMRIFTSQAYASFDFQKNTASILRSYSAAGAEKQVHEAPGFDPLLEQARDFIRCVRLGKRPLVSGEDGLRALKFARIVMEKIAERELVFQDSPKRTSPVSQSKEA